ncbi:MAG: serine hydrolase, partial [Gemmatimonadaceae bacterium]|nr:serine hydrolase [Gemmatimonadaceae bacterium]
MPRLLRLAAAAASTFGAPAFAQTPAAPAAASPGVVWTADSLRGLLAARVRLGRNPGIVAAVITPQGTVSAVAGIAGSPDGAPLTGRTMFEIGSITKAVTGTLFADAIARGEVRADERLIDVLPDLPLPDSARGITLLDLATHRSGLAGFPAGHEPTNMAEPWAGVTKEVVYASLRRPGALRFAPGSRAEYSNVGAGLLGQALVSRAKLANGASRDYATLVRERIAGPLGLRDFVMTLSAAQERRFAQPYAQGEPTAHWSLDYLAAAGAIRAPLDDMTRFARACLGDAPAGLAAAITDAQRPRRAFTRDSIGLHWVTTRGPAGPIAWHNGGTGGFRTWLGCNRVTGRAAVVMTNGDAGADDIGFHLVDAGLPLKAPSPLPRAAVTVDTATMNGLLGTYRLAPTFALTVTREGTRLYVQATGQPKLECVPATTTRWLLKAVDAALEFERDGNAAATAVVLVQGGGRQRAARETAPPPSP